MELLSWSQNKSLNEVQDNLKLLTLDKTVDGEYYIPLDLFPERVKKVTCLKKNKADDEECSDEGPLGFLFEDMKLQR